MRATQRRRLANPTRNAARPNYLPYSVDSTESLNEWLLAAYQSDGVFTLPKGTLYVSGPLEVLRGWENLTIQGHPDGTILQALIGFEGTAMITLANNVPNNVNDLWDITLATRLTVQEAIEGQRQLILNIGEDAINPGTYWGLADQDTIPELDESTWNNITYRAEILQVVAYDEDSRIATLSNPLTRTYDQSPQLTPLNVGLEGDRTCRNITIQNLTLNGDVSVGETPYYVDGGIYAEFTVGLTVKNVTTQRFRDSHVRTDVCTAIEVADLTIEGEHFFEENPLLRGINFFWCHDIRMQNVSADKVRHGVQFSLGNADATLDGYVATNSYDDSPDFHGGRNIRCTVRNLTTDKSCKVGNVSYPAGDQDIRVINGTCDEYLRVQGGSQVVAVNIAAQNAALAVIRGYPQYYPHDCTYRSCQFVSPLGGVNNNVSCSRSNGNGSGQEFTRFSGQLFDGCLFDQQNSDGTFNAFFEEVNLPSDMEFLACQFSTSGTPAAITYDNPIAVPSLYLRVSGSQFYGPLTASAIRFEASSYGGIVAFNNTFETEEPDPVFISVEEPAYVSIDVNVDNVIL